MRSRDYTSSGPVRYIPKTSPKEKISESSPWARSSEKSRSSSHHTVSASKINGGKGVNRRLVHCEKSQVLDETHNDREWSCESFLGNRDGEWSCDRIRFVMLTISIKFGILALMLTS